jgi:hypothetical protein
MSYNLRYTVQVTSYKLMSYEIGIRYKISLAQSGDTLVGAWIAVRPRCILIEVRNYQTSALANDGAIQ